MERIHRLDEDGFQLLHELLTDAECLALIDDWNELTESHPHPALLRTEDGTIYGARNLLEIWPGIETRTLKEPIRNHLRSLLGDGVGLVRVLFFDKPPEHSWALPWHRDVRIAVKDNTINSEGFSKPTLKYGVPHLEAPIWLLQRMLILRLHLDEVTEENGPLRAIPGSHRHMFVGSPKETEVVTVLSQAGDALLMQPLLYHSSNHSAPGCLQNRRVLHFEFSGVKELPEGFEWHDFLPL
jgi:hypothetical protein